jgi:hypothetical protein
LPVIIIFGIITSYGDIKSNRIRNRWILLAIVYSFIATFALFLSLLFSNQPINYSYLTDYILNFSIAFVFGFVLLYMHLWSAGDAKLFTAYAALIPLSIYSAGYVPYFPSIALLINTFVPFLAVFLIKSIIAGNLNKKTFGNIFNIESVIKALIAVFSISWIFSFIKTNIFVNFILVFVAYFILEKALKKKFIMIMLAIAVTRVVFQYQYIITADFLLNFALLFIFLILSRAVLIIAREDATRPVSIDILKPGMMPSEIVYKKGRVLRKININNPDFKKFYKKSMLSAPLTEKDIGLLKKLEKEEKLSFKELDIQKTVPFAPLIFIGVILTLIFQGNLFALLLNYI